MKPIVDALEMLVAQHEEIEDLLARISSATQPSEKARVFADLIDAVVAYTDGEDALFLPAVRCGETATLVDGAVGAHGAMRSLLAELMELDPTGRRFDDRLAVLAELVADEARDQGEELFPLVDQRLSESELAALGRRLAERCAYPRAA